MVSIIIPIYNVEQYIIACLESVEAQTYTDYEVILVDDCGTDNTMAVAKEFISKSKVKDKFRIVCHEYNKGNSAARNTGIAAAKGTYIYQLDDDDTMTPDCLEKLVKTAEKTDADMVVGNFDIIGDEKDIPRIHTTEESMSGEDCFYAYLHDQFQMMVWNKLIRRDLLFKTNLVFIEGLAHEDNAWSFSLACLLQRMAFVHDVTYHYVVRSGTIHADKNFTKHYNSYCFLLKYYVDEAKKYNKADDVEFRRWLERQKALHFKQTMINGTMAQQKELYAIIRKTIPQGAWNKQQVHYLLPSFLGILAYKKWCGMWLV